MPVYLAETLLWPEVNERRVILVLPVLVAWYVLGAKAAWDAAWSWTQRRVGPAARRRGPGVGAGKATLGGDGGSDRRAGHRGPADGPAARGTIW